MMSLSYDWPTATWIIRSERPSQLQEDLELSPEMMLNLMLDQSVCFVGVRLLRCAALRSSNRTYRMHQDAWVYRSRRQSLHAIVAVV